MSGAILWANLHLLCWLSLLLFATGWMGENHFVALTAAFYGFILMMSAMAFTLIEITLIRVEGEDSRIARALGRDFKGNISIVVYLAAIPLSSWNRWLALTCYVAVAVLWLIPDRRIEKNFAREHDGANSG